MVEIRKDGKTVFYGTKENGVYYLKEKGLIYKSDDIPFLILGYLATNMGYEVYAK